jgi:AcrR family transcriptional regulator
MSTPVEITCRQVEVLMAPIGRRPGASTTREAILSAARNAFAEVGYERATIRLIARRAGVDPALVMQFFGSKDGLYAAAIGLPFNAAQVVASLLHGPKKTLGERIVRQFFGIWEDPESGPRMLGLLRAATSNPDAAKALATALAEQLLGPIAAALELPDRELRAQLTGAQLVGLAFTRYVLALESLASTDREAIVAAVGPTVQRYLTDPTIKATATSPRSRGRSPQSASPQ